MGRFPIRPYVDEALRMAAAAREAGTYAVGGVLIDNHTGAILNSVHNKVVVAGNFSDHTAHVERQLITWYFDQQAASSNGEGAQLPPPQDMTIVSSLDPCPMCAGALLLSGINVVAISQDKVGGVNHDGANTFLSVPAPLRPQIVEKFAYLGLEDGTRAFFGPPTSLFYGAVVPAEVESANAQMALDSINGVRQTSCARDAEPLDVDTATLRDTCPALVRDFPDTGTEKIDMVQVADRRRLRSRLVDVAAGAKGSKNAAALLGSFGQLLLVTRLAVLSDSAADPIDTPLMRLVRNYASYRLDDPTGGAVLPHIRRCRIVLLRGPGADAEGLMDLGVLGLTVRRTSGETFYFYARQSEEALDAMVMGLPPIFAGVMRMQRVGVDEDEERGRASLLPHDWLH